jgi:hypothetical protein
MIDWTLMQSPETRAATALAAQRAAITARRNAAMAAGITVAGLPIATDDVSQARITGAALAALADPAAEIRWKLPDGRFVHLAAAEVLAIAGALRAHVQACFDREAELQAALAAGAPLDAETGWPDQTDPAALPD